MTDTVVLKPGYMSELPGGAFRNVDSWAIVITKSQELEPRNLYEAEGSKQIKSHLQ